MSTLLGNTKKKKKMPNISQKIDDMIESLKCQIEIVKLNFVACDIGRKLLHVLMNMSIILSFV